MALRRTGFGRQNLLAAASAAAVAIAMSASAATPMNWPSGWSDAFGSEAGVNLGTSVTINAYSSNTSAGSQYTYVDRSVAVLNSVTVYSIGLYCPTAVTGMAVKLFKRNSAGNYDVVATQAVNHPGGGWYDVALTTPYAVPGTGTYYLGGMAPSGINFGQTANTGARSYKTGDVTGTGQTGFTEDTSGQTVVTRYSHSSPTVNATYDAANDWYKPSIGYSAISGATGTAFGDMTAGSAITTAFDGDNSTGPNRGNSTSAYIGKNYSGGKAVHSVVVTGRSDAGFANITPNVTINLRGKTSVPASASDGTLLGTTGSFTDTSNAIVKTITSNDTTTLYAYVWVELTYDVTCQPFIGELVINEAVFNNMSVQSIARTSPVGAPKAADLYVDIVENEAITLNTHLVAKISTDGGTTWHTCTLVAVPTSNTTKTYVAANENLADAGGGSSVAVKVEINGKDAAYTGYHLELAA